jgi:ribA/ribD-fused uncharacterized protein
MTDKYQLQPQETKKQEVQQIAFYDANEIPYGVFCNYYPAVITINGKTFKSTEEFYQWSKFDDEWYKEEILKTNTPNKSRILGHQEIKHDHDWRKPLNSIVEESLKRGIKCKENFEQIKDKVMLTALWAKFNQHANLQEILLTTDDAYIYENSPYDYYWGVGSNKTGKNKLGILLMYVRNEIRKEKEKVVKQ